MPTHDYDIANQSFPAVRSDINAALQAIMSANSGTSWPATIAHMRAVDTAAGVLMRRNAANNAWRDVESTADSLVVDRSANTVITRHNIGWLIRATASYTQAFDSAATLGATWACWFRVEPGVTLTLDPAGTELVDGAATLAVVGPAAFRLSCTGTEFRTQGLETVPIARGGTGATTAAAARTAIQTLFHQHQHVNATMTGGFEHVGRLLECVNTITLNLTAAATMGNGAAFGVRNTGSGTVTIDPAGTETIDGAATLALAPGESCICVSSGAAWFTVGRATQPPTGAMLDFAGAGAAPAGYLLANGANVSRTTFAALFAVIGTNWGAGDGTTTFTLPDTRRRVAVGSGGTGTGTLGNAVGNVGGAETHTLTIAEMPGHVHPINGHTNTAGVVNHPTFLANSSADVRNTESAGGGAAHNNMQPSYVVQKIIKT